MNIYRNGDAAGRRSGLQSRSALAVGAMWASLADQQDAPRCPIVPAWLGIAPIGFAGHAT